MARWSGRAVIGMFLALTLAMSGFTLLVFKDMQRWDIGDAAYVVNPGFNVAGDAPEASASVPDGWTRVGERGSVSVADGKLIIDSDAPRGSVGIEQKVALPKGIDAFELSARVELQAVPGGDRRWHRARIDFVSLDEDDEPDFSRPHKLLEARGTRPAFTYRRMVRVVPDAADAMLSIRLARTTGRLIVSDLELRPANERDAFWQMKLLVWAGWSIVLLAAGTWLVATAAHRPAAIAAVVVLIAAGLFTLMPYEVKEPVLNLVNPFRGDADLSDRELASHALHVVGFLALGFLVRLARRRDPVVKIALGLILVSALAELLQALSTDIGIDDLIDVATNIIGIVVGVGAGQEHVRRHYGLRRRRRRSHRDDSEASGEPSSPMESKGELESSPI